MTADTKALLIFLVLAAAAVFVNYLLKEWPAVKRTLFEVHCDDALEVVRNDRSYAMHPGVKEAAIRRTGDDVERMLRDLGQTVEGKAYAAEVMVEIRQRKGRT